MRATRTRLKALAAAGVLLVAGACTNASPPEANGSGACGSWQGAPDGSLTPRAGAAALFAQGGTLMELRLGSDELATLAGAESGAPLRFPRYRGAGGATAVAGESGADQVVSAGVAGQLDPVLRVDGTVLDHGWDRAGGRVAYLVQGATGVALCVGDLELGRTRLLRLLDRVEGRSPRPEDDLSIGWDSAGEKILVVATILGAAEGAPLMLVVDATSGSDEVGPRAGTFAQFVDDDRIVYRELGEASAERWMLLDTASGAEEALPLPAGTFRGAVSPSGSLIALDDGGATPVTQVLELESGRLVASLEGYVGPVWAGDDILLATAAEPCGEGVECDVREWRPVGPVGRFDAGEWTRRVVPIPTTLSPQFALALDTTG